MRGSACNNAPGFVCRGHVVTWTVNFHGEHMARFPNTTEPHGPHRSCDGHHIIVDYREDCDRQHSRETSAVISCQRELPIEWVMAMSTSTNQTSPTQGDYHLPFGKVEARLHMKLQKVGRQYMSIALVNEISRAAIGGHFAGLGRQAKRDTHKRFAVPHSSSSDSDCFLHWQP